MLQIYNTQKQHCSIKTGCSYKFRKIHRKIPVSKSLFKWSCRPQAWNFIKKETLTEVFSCEFCAICKNIFFPYPIIFLPLILSTEENVTVTFTKHVSQQKINENNENMNENENKTFLLVLCHFCDFQSHKYAAICFHIN